MSEKTNAVAVRQQDKLSLISRFSDKYGIDSGKLLETLKQTAFKQYDNRPISNEQMCALMIVAEKYDLNPFVKQIYAYPDKSGGIVPLVAVDGWDHIINSHPQFDGIDFVYSDNLLTIGKSKECYEWIECRIHRKDRSKPIIVREYLDECYRENNIAWNTHTKRMLRHKALIQCARVAFGFGGIYDEDEGRLTLKNRDAEFVEDLAAPVETTAVVVDSTPNQSPAPAETPAPEKTKRKRKSAPAETPQPEPAPDPESEPEQIQNPVGDADFDIEM